jgi:hypothetical protein
MPARPAEKLQQLLTMTKVRLSQIWRSASDNLQHGWQWLTRPSAPINWRTVRASAGSRLRPRSIASRTLAVFVLLVVLVTMTPRLWELTAQISQPFSPIGRRNWRNHRGLGCIEAGGNGTTSARAANRRRSPASHQRKLQQGHGAVGERRNRSAPRWHLYAGTHFARESSRLLDRHGNSDSVRSRARSLGRR